MPSKRFVILPHVILLALLITTIFLIPYLPHSYFGIAYQALFTAIILASVFVLEKSRRFNLMIAMTFIAIKWLILIYDKELRNLSNIPQVLFFMYIVGCLLAQISSTSYEKGHVIIDCINGYFLLALASAVMVGIAAHFSPSSFNFRDVSQIPVEGMNEYIYYSMVTFSTTGFGDIIPTTPVAKSISNAISVSGQLYVAIVIALLIGHKTTTHKD